MNDAMSRGAGSASGGKAFFKSLFQNKKRLSLVLILVLVAGYFIYKHYSTSLGPVRYVLAQASKQTIIASVSASGQVSQDRSVNITPLTSAKLVSVNVKQGQQVKAGQIIATVDESNATIALNQARASLASAQASYDQALVGATSQDLQLSQLSVDSAQQALDNAKTNLATVTKQQAQTVSNAFTTMLSSGLQAIPANNNINTNPITITGTYTSTEQGSYKIITYSTNVGQWYSTGLETSSGDITKNAANPLGNRGLYIQFTGNIYNGDSWTIAIPNTQSANYNSNYNAYQTALSNQASAIATAQSQIVTAQNNLKQAQINQEVKQAPPTQQQIESARAQLLNAQASLQNAQITYNNNILKSPFDGIVAQVNSQVGDQVTGSTIVAVVVTNRSLATVSLNEVDVSKIKEGDKATMTFDAVDGLTLTGKVAQIDQLGTVSQGVVNYNVKIAFDTEDPRTKPGMSTNVSIITNLKPDVLAVPNSAVKTQNGRSYVQTLDPAQIQSDPAQTGATSNTTPKQVTVEVGLSNDTYTEITSGLKEGDSVVSQTITPTTGKSTAASATNLLRVGGGGGGFGGGGAGVRTGAGGGARGN